MRRLATMLTSAVLFVGLATSAYAAFKYPPGQPNRTCPDTLKIFQIQQEDTTIALCHPALLDTVLGVRGIITAFDAKASAYGFYMQNRFANGLGQFTGIDVFTGATNYNSSVPTSPSGGNLAVGDSVVVYGTTQEFPAVDGESEIEGPDVIQSTDDIVIRKINSGNPLPAFHVGTTAEFNWIPGVSAATAEPWEGCLVRLNGPLKVARIQEGAGVAGNTFLIVKPSAPSDSVLIDGFTLTTLGTPAVGDDINFVQGILNQRNSTANTGSINSYRIQPRSGDDISILSPPGLIDAYHVAENKVRVVFDRKIDKITGLQIPRYELASQVGGSSITAVAFDLPDSDKVILTVTESLAHGSFETITVSGVGSATCPACTTGTGTRDYVTGILTCAQVQSPDPAFLATFEDRSKYAGEGAAVGTRLTVQGVSVKKYGSLEYLNDEAGGFRSGVVVFGSLSPLTPTEKYMVAVQALEFGGETEIQNMVYLKDLGAGTVPAPQVQTVGVLSDTTTDQSGGAVPGARKTGEDYEGALVRLNYVSVCAFSTPPRDPQAGGSFLVTNLPRAKAGTGNPPPDTILVSANSTDVTFDADTLQVVNVTGILHFSNGTFRILPRDDSDITLVVAGVGDESLRELSLAVSPNPGREQRIDYVVPRRGVVDLAVFDLQGRRMATLAKGMMPAGSYTQRWNGTDHNGKVAGAGMYFYRLRVDGEERVSRAVSIH